MGYVHNWKNVPTHDHRYTAALQDCVAIVSSDHGVPLAGPNGTGAPVAGKEGIALNGVADDCHRQAFILKHDYDGSSDCCRTNAHPYDLIVVACLCALADRCGPVVTSDGEPARWGKGRALAERVLGRPIANPMDAVEAAFDAGMAPSNLLTNPIGVLEAAFARGLSRHELLLLSKVCDGDGSAVSTQLAMLGEQLAVLREPALTAGATTTLVKSFDFRTMLSGILIVDHEELLVTQIRVRALDQLAEEVPAMMFGPRNVPRDTQPPFGLRLHADADFEVTVLNRAARTRAIEVALWGFKF